MAFVGRAWKEKQSEQCFGTVVHREKLKVVRAFQPGIHGEGKYAVGKLLGRKPECHSCLSRDKTIVEFIDTIAEIQILSYLAPEEI